jgi:hypothetical protein
MKSIILVCAAVIVTSSAFAGNNTANNTNHNSTVNTLTAHASHFTNSSRKNKRHKIKQMFKNPFRIISLGRNNRY